MNFEFNLKFPDATNEQKFAQIRLWRNAELTATDWTQLQDSTADKSAWAEYRQALRDLPTQSDNADKIIIPNRPK